MKQTVVGMLILLMSAMVHGGGEALYKEGATVYKTDPSKAFELFVRAAEAGHPSAMAGAGHCYETGTGTMVDYAKAIEWYEKAVGHNSLKAGEGLARIYASCIDAEFHDGEKAVRYASVIVRKKPRDAEALALLAAAYARNIDFEMAIKTQTAAQRIAPLSESKEFKQQISKYSDGEPFPPMATEAWVLRAANAEALWAVVKLARWTGDPDGELYNPHLALKMCQKGIDRGRFDLSILKGNLYFDNGDLDKAYACYQEANRNRQYSVKTRLSHFLKREPERVYEWGKKFRDGYEERYTDGKSTSYYDSAGREIEVPTPVKVRRIPPCHDSAEFLFEIAAKKGHSQAAQALRQMQDGKK